MFFNLAYILVYFVFYAINGLWHGLSCLKEDVDANQHKISNLIFLNLM